MRINAGLLLLIAPLLSGCGSSLGPGGKSDVELCVEAQLEAYAATERFSSANRALDSVFQTSEGKKRADEILSHQMALSAEQEAAITAMQQAYSELEPTRRKAQAYLDCLNATAAK